MKYGKFTFSCRFKSKALLPGYKGSTFRGVFGHALKRVVCALKQQTCEQCLLRERCLYFRVFETPNAADAKGPNASAPHPFVIEPPLNHKTLFEGGDEFDCNLILFGEYVECLTYFIYAFDQMGRVGIGRHIDGKRGRFQVETVGDGQGILFKDGEGRLVRPNSTLSIDSKPADPAFTGQSTQGGVGNPFAS